MKYQLAVFDLDGTILNTLDDLADSLNAALAAAGYPLRTRDEVRCFVGNGIRKLMERGVPEGTPTEEIDRVHRLFTAHYNAHCADKTGPYAGIPALLVALRAAGMRTAVLSNKADEAVQKLCARYFPGMFDAVQGERAPFPRKPEPDALYAMLGELGIAREETVYIGDSEVDIATARNAGLAAILVDWGFRDRETLLAAGAESIVSAPEDLEQRLLS